LPFLSRVFADPDFAAGRYDIGFVSRKLPELVSSRELDDESRLLVAAAAAVGAHVRAETRRGSDERRAPGLSPWVQAHRHKLER
jgi:acetyl/propionyl-CoA carboxylase alpha subunit